MIWRMVLLLLLTATPLRADAEQEITDMVSTMATALSEAKPQEFLDVLDRSMPGYQQLENFLRALAADTPVSCSVDLIDNSGTERAQTADLDWYMVLRSQQDENLIERRRTKVTIKMEKRGKKWIVTSFTPISIFAPMTAK